MHVLELSPGFGAWEIYLVNDSPMPGIAQHYEPVPGELTAQTRSYVQFVFGRGQI